MIMSLFAQIALLFWKNLIVMWRSKLWLVAEILFSLFLLPYIIVVVRYAPAPSKEDAYSFEPFFIAGNSSDIERKINNSASIDTYYNCHHDLYLGYSYEAGLANLSNSLMAKIREHYSDNLTMKIEVQNFGTAKQMVKELEKDLNQTREEMCGQFLGGVHFTNIRLRERNSEPHLIYRIFLPKRNMKWQLIDSFWLDDDPNGPQSDHNQIPSEPPYWQSGFLSIQYAIETTFLEMNNVGSGIKGFSLNNSIFSFLRIPIDQSSSGSMILFLKYMYILWLVALMGIMLHTSKNIVLEKEAGIKTYMSVMGLQPMAFYYSHIIIGFFKATLVMILCTNILCKGLHFTSTTVFIFFSVIFGLAMVILSALISAIVKKPQLTQFMANLIPALLLVLTIGTTPSISKIDLCLLTSLNPITAFKLGVAQIINSETKMVELGWNSIFNGFTTQFTIGLAMLMLIFDCVLYSILICYFDLVLPTDETPKKHPLFFLECFDSIFKRNNFDYTGEDEMDNAINENMEQEHGNLEEADIIVNHMSKNWGGGNLAVNNLNFRAYKGQLTVLLGHNGAGKTTTFSVLTGSIDSSAGQVFICKKDLKLNLHDCQKNMGYCPQNNPLFDKLNIREHLKLYAGLKTGYFCGPFGRRALDQEINQIVKNVGLEEKINTEAQNLSGGQKRKLCVAISLVAGSRVVLLDEPTAGMDPEARNEIGKLLAQAKKERTILMTTHYMEEADLLGDRIGIMVNGRLVCNGSPEFLKNKYSAGYILSFVCAGFDFAQNETSSDNLRLFNQTINRILGIVRKYSPNARVEKAQRPPEFAIILPVSDKKHYANLFEELENGKILLGISSFGLSLNTLEQVFLRVGELAEPEVTDQVDGSSAEQLAKDLFSARQQQFLNAFLHQFALLFRQLAALFYRHLLWTCRNPMRSLLPLAIALFSFIFLGLIFKPSSPLLRQNRSLSLDDAHEKMRIPIQIRGSSAKKLQEQFKKLSELFCSNCLLTINAKKDLHDELKKELINFPPMVAGVAIYENISTGKFEIEALFNGIAVHSPPMALSFITNALLGAKKFSIRPSIEIYDVPSNGTIDDEAFTKVAADFINNAMVSGVIIMCFSIFGATMVVPLVEEKSGKFKHQLMLTKLHIITYWVSVFLWNLVFYVIFCAILAIFFLYFGWMKDYMADLCLLWALYFWSYVPMNAVISFIFDKPQRAFTAVLSWSMVASILFLMASTSLAYVFNLRKMAEVMDTFLYILTPVYALGSGILKIFLHSFALSLENYDDWYLKKHFELMLLSGIFFWTILTILQSRMLATKFHQLSCQIFHRRLYQRILDLDEDVAQEDQDIRNERERLDTQESRIFALTVRNLSKYYGRLPALRNLTFGVKQKECFGLLGVNGAGKTTTFDILTGVRFATSGSATVGGINVNKAPAIGYCPQFDALPMELTGREVLTLLAHLNDFSDIKIRVNQIIWSIRMEKHADKKIINYSGGQRRRISIGITLVTRSSLIMLDEPTAGIDPKTRRQIWQLLQAIRQQGIAILLTSHSMDECEELCNKIGFLNRGRLVGIGSSQHLKSRFGNSYLLTITVANPTPAVLAHLNKHVVEKFKALPTEDLPTSRTLHWQVPKQENMTWSWLYRMAQKLADLYPDHPQLLTLDNDRPKIVDFSLTQNSLEQVFMRLSKGLPD